jgi:signal transduction histidine kinase
MARRWSVPDTPHLREMAETQQPLLIADTRQFAGWEMPTVRSFIGASIRFKRKLSGFLSLESETPNFFLPAYADRLQVFANQAAVAIENARLYRLEQEQFQQWQQSQATLAQTEKMGALDRLAATLAHEIDRPLQAIQHHLGQIVDIPQYTPNQLQALDTARQEVERLRQMMRNMSTFTQPAPEPHRPMAIDEVIHDALAEIARPIEQYGITVTTDLQPTPLVSVAPKQMTQVFVNLLLNATEAVQHRGQIHIATQAETAHIVVTIVNDGPPIKPENLPHIFEPFFTTKKGSTGLGLTVSHSLVQQHGGTITAMNLTTQRGAVMTVKLPVMGTA